MNQAGILILENPNSGRLEQWPKPGDRAEIKARSTTRKNEIGVNLPKDKEI